MSNILKYGVPIIILIIFYSCDCDCKTEKKNNIKELSIQHISELEQINSMILRNIKLLEDSCCKNIGSALSGNACSDPDSVRKNYFYPATRHLLNLYLPASENVTLKLIDKLSPNSYYSNDDIVITNFSFRSDSTVKYPVFYKKCGDTITEHYIIFQKSADKSGGFFSDNKENIELVKQKKIKPNWTYYIIKYPDN